jgi:orotate phosphoribosyltransferase
MCDKTSGTPDRLLALLRERCYRSGAVTLSSGKSSDFYCDGKMVALMGEGAHLIGEVFCDALADQEFDAIGGLAVGAVPLVTSAVVSCYQHGRPVEGLFVRSDAKGHGTRKRVEGKLRPGDRVVIIDDAATTGNSLMRAVRAVEEEGATVVLVLVLVDRREGAETFFREHGYPFRSIFTKEEVMDTGHHAPHTIEIDSKI